MKIAIDTVGNAHNGLQYYFDVFQSVSITLKSLLRISPTDRYSLAFPESSTILFMCGSTGFQRHPDTFTSMSQHQGGNSCAVTLIGSEFDFDSLNPNSLTKVKIITST